MSLGSSRQHGELCVEGHPGRIVGCPWDPPDSMDTFRQHWTALAFEQSLVNDSTANTATFTKEACEDRPAAL